ncbi:biosynthetic-type acetolactate synthase large subunit [Candidatus Woesearchaeota archaeon]|nr:biosynthetic-type acetolactate synthase large subunit [Candidatus Woesearchaeota archaeon]
MRNRVITIKGKDIIVECLKRQGTKQVFGITGGAIIPLYDALYDHPDIQNIICRHEQGAAHMAAGFARACGKPGVILGTSGPGGTNMVTGIMDAHMDSTPMVAMAGQVPISLIGKDAFQETDMVGITMPITKHNFKVTDPEKMAEIILKAFKIATEGRPGPVYIDLPKDMQSADVKTPIPDKVFLPSYKPTIKPNPLPIKRAAEIILRSERPLIIAGGGCIIAGAQNELVEFVNAVKIPVNTTTMGKGIFPENHPLSLGVMGMHGEEHANYAAINCDCLIALGCRFSDRITGDTKTFAPHAKIIHADVDPSEIGKNVRVDVPIVGDAKHIITMLHQTILQLAQKDSYKSQAWIKKLQELKEMTHSAEERDVKGMTQGGILKILNKFKQETDIVATGVGQHQMFGEHFLSFTQPRTWITSGGAGTMGYGLPAALGAKVAKPDRTVWDLDGDGSFQMTSQELATAKQFSIKVNTVIMNNENLGMVRQWLDIFSEKRFSGIDYGKSNPNFVKLAQAYQLDGIHVTRESEMIDALKAALKSEETFVIDCAVPKEDFILPMLPPGKGLQHIIGGKTIFKQTWDEVR